MDRVLRQRHRRTTCALYIQSSKLDELIGPLPEEGEIVKVVSLANLSAAGFLRYISDHATIQELTVSTYRIGPNTLRQLRRLRDMGHLQRAAFIVGKLMSRDNHTKLALFDTDKGKFVLEGSCNLNEAPNYEQFSLCQDAELYDFYSAALREMMEDRK